MGVFGYDLLDPALYENGFPHRVFTGIRRDCPVAWHEPSAGGPVTDGFWSIAGHREVVGVLQRTETISVPAPTVVDDAVGLAVLELARRPEVLAEVRSLGWAIAADELARWVCPQTVVWCRSTEELELGRHRVAPGERLACWLPSANRDEAVFGRDAMDLVLTRRPNPHLSFWQVPDGLDRFRGTLAEVLDAATDLVLTGEPEWVSSVDRSALLVLPVELVRP